jgi:hypothetical protein
LSSLVGSLGQNPKRDVVLDGIWRKLAKGGEIRSHLS